MWTSSYYLETRKICFPKRKKKPWYTFRNLLKRYTFFLVNHFSQICHGLKDFFNTLKLDSNDIHHTFESFIRIEHMIYCWKAYERFNFFHVDILLNSLLFISSYKNATSFLFSFLNTQVLGFYKFWTSYLFKFDLLGFFRNGKLRL